MPKYLLASHVYFCITGDHVVLLDLKRDKYLTGGRAEMKALAACVKGWPASGQEFLSPAEDAFISKMLHSSMLTTDLASGKEARPIAMPRPEMTLEALDLATRRDIFDMRPPITLGDVMNFLYATLSARAALKWRPMASVVAKVKARKARRTASQALDLAAARQHVAAFVHLRPFLFTTEDACLADSLALVNFLSHYGVFPTWVFGVRTRPFAAHCWVQEGEVIFNDTPDHVRRYTPILTI